MQVERGTVGQVNNTAGYKSPEKDKDKELYDFFKKGGLFNEVTKGKK